MTWIFKEEIYFNIFLTSQLCDKNANSLKSGRLIPPALFFFLKIALALWGLLCFYTNYEIFCSSSVKNTISSLLGIVLNL